MSGRQPDLLSEARLEELRREAMETGWVKGTGVRLSGAPFPQASPETGYYGLPVLKAPTWTWEVPVYFFVGGAAGASAIVAFMAELADRAGVGDRPLEALARDARWVAFVGSLLSAPLLIMDLGRPERFLYMLRVFKPRSPMSMGAWTLTVFGASTAKSVAAHLIQQRLGGRGPSVVRSIAGLTAFGAQGVAAVAGAGMSTYTGILVGATAIPVWKDSARELPVLFGASGLGSGVAVLELLGHRQPALSWLGTAAAAVETVLAVRDEVGERGRRRSLRPLREGASGRFVRAGALLAGPVSLLLRAAGARRGAAVASLAGSMLTRWGWVEAGKASAEDPVPALGGEPKGA